MRSGAVVVTCEHVLQVQVCVERLTGCLPVYREAESRGEAVRPSALAVEALLVSYDEVLGTAARTTYAEADFSGTSWGCWLGFPIKVGRAALATSCSPPSYLRLVRGCGGLPPWKLEIISPLAASVLLPGPREHVRGGGNDAISGSVARRQQHSDAGRIRALVITGENQPPSCSPWLQYRDLGHTAQVALTVWEVREGAPQRPLGGATLRLFSKKGRLKTGSQELQLWPGQEADVRWPSSTPGKVPVAERGELG